MYRFILWGSAVDYNLFCKWFEPEVLKGKMLIEGIMLNEEGAFGELDGIPVISPEELLNLEYDYLVDMNRQNREMVAKIRELLQIPREKVIPVKVFGQPFFDLTRWINVQKRNVSIVANNCWGGYTYNSLGLEFKSPFINMFILSEDYLKLLSNLEYYMKQPLTHVKDEFDQVLQRNYPVVALEDVKLHCNHYINFEQAAFYWNKRKERMNYENLLVEMIIDTYEEMEAFIRLPYKHKVGFTILPCSEENIIYFPVKEEYLKLKYDGNHWNFINHMAMRNSDEFRRYDILKLLNFEDEFIRTGG